MSSASVVIMVGKASGMEADTLAVVGALAAAGVLLRALQLLRDRKDSALEKLLGAVRRGDKGGRCGTKRKYDWEMEVLGEACATCYDAQVKREFAEDGY